MTEMLDRALLNHAPAAPDAPPHLPGPRHGGPAQDWADEVLAGQGLTCMWQPVVDLVTGETVGAEALARGPVGTPLAFPDALFGLAAERGRVAELDESCRRTALRSAVAGDLTGPLTVFLNAEPEGLGLVAREEGIAAELAALTARGVRVVLEITERALTRDPAGLLAAVKRVRAMGWAIAVDDVGAVPASLALMPFLAPDVIKLDLRLIQERTSTETARIVNAVLAQAERTGAVILAEGIETQEHLNLARSMGATVGQGWLLGRPAPVSALRDRPKSQLALPEPDRTVVPATPWSLVAGSGRVRTARKPLLVAMSLTLERQLAASGEAAVILGTFQHNRYVTPGTRLRYGRLGQASAFAAVFGVDVSTDPIPLVRHVDLAPACPLTLEWDVVVVGPHFAAALIALDRGTDAAEDEREFDYAITYDRCLVLAAARALMGAVTTPA